MILPMYDNVEDTIVACKVHDMVLDLIASFSSEDNFVTILNGIGDSIPSQNNVRRLSLQNARKGETQNISLECMSMSQVRSIALFEHAIDLMPSFSSFVVLRVLELNGCDLRDHNHLKLGELGSLLHLRYLGLCKTGISELSEEVGKLQHLQVLDLSQNSYMKLPSTFIKLRRLMCLLIDYDHKRFPDGLGNLTSMKVLSYICDDSLSTMKGLGSMERLRELEIWFDNMSLELKEAFVQSVGKMSNIQILRVHYKSDGVELMDLMGERWLPPRGLREVILTGGIQFSTLPAWIRRNPMHLSRLSKLEITVEKVRQEDLDVLGRLPTLRILYLSSHRQSRLLLVGADGFRCLTSFKLFSLWPGQIVLQPGALPKAERVDLCISLQVAKEEAAAAAGSGSYWFDMGLGSLPSLRRAVVRFYRWGVTVGEARQAKFALQNALSAHPSRQGCCILFRPIIPPDVCS
uniref:Uncharacterized protein n=1 Tax=Avena sativa TaxID=4498 RepID=A0ACD5WSS6_AVESA